MSFIFMSKFRQNDALFKGANGGRGMSRLIHIIGAISAALVLFAGSASTQELRPDAQVAAEAALIGNRPAEAVRLTNMILQVNPDSYAALFVKAAALIDIQDYRNAAQSAADAFGVARSPTERVQSARLASRAHRLAGQYVRAEWWLRRAANQAATEDDAINIARDMRAIRQENPFSVDLNFGIAPTDNINNGSEDGFVLFEGLGTIVLPPEQRPLSGIEYSGDLRIEYRLSESERQRSSVGLYLYGRTYTPSQSAKDAVPGLSGSDYALALGEVYLSHARLVFPELGVSEIIFHIGHLNYGGEAYWDYGKVTLAQDVVLDASNVLTFRASREWQYGIERRHEDTGIFDTGVTLRRTRENRDLVEFDLAFKDYDTDAFEASYIEYRAQLGYRFAKPVMGVTWGGALSVGYLDYPAFFASLDGRRDTYVSVSANATWRDVSFYGFAPRIDLIAETRESNVGQFSTNSLQMRFGIESNF